MNVIIIEDESLSADHLALLLAKVDAAIHVVARLHTVKSSVTAFGQGLQADLVFMDIHLADGNSFDIFQAVDVAAPVIFTTAFDNYAIQAFKQNSIDYLLKPIQLKDLQAAVQKFRQQQQAVNVRVFEQMAQAYRQGQKQYKSRFLVKAGQHIDHVGVEQIAYFETRESLSYLVTLRGDRYAVDHTLDQLEVLLQPRDFFRINRGIIVHIQSVQKVTTYFNGRLAIGAGLPAGDARIVSRERVAGFRKWLDS